MSEQQDIWPLAMSNGPDTAWPVLPLVLPLVLGSGSNLQTAIGLQRSRTRCMSL